MNAGNIPEDPLARGLYLEIAQIEEEHVTHYESILDPTMGWLTNLVLHEYNECWLYWSCMQTETDNRIRALWELHLGMEIEHLRIACEMLEQVDGIDPQSFLPAAGFSEPLTFEPNKEYVRDVLRRTVDWTGFDAQFVPVDDLPPDHRFFAYQNVVNEGGVPIEQVIERRRSEKGDEYRLATDGDHPVEALCEDGPHEKLGYYRAGRTSAPSRVLEEA